MICPYRAKTSVLKSAKGKEIEIDMVQLPPGDFLMGGMDGPTIHRVEITKPFMMATKPVTQKLYTIVMGKNPSSFKGDDLPVEKVSWFDAVAFCNPQMSSKSALRMRSRVKMYSLIITASVSVFPPKPNGNMHAGLAVWPFSRAGIWNQIFWKQDGTIKTQKEKLILLV